MKALVAAVAQPPQRHELFRSRSEFAREPHREAVGIAQAWQLARVAGKERDERLLERPQGERRAERQLVDDDMPRPHACEDRRELAGHPFGLPEHVVAPRPDLVGDRRDHPLASGVVERAEVLTLLLCVSTDAVVVTLSEPQLDMLEAVGQHALPQRRPGRDDHVSAPPSPLPAQGRQAEVVRRVVGADEQRGHAYRSTSPAAIASIVKCSRTVAIASPARRGSIRATAAR